MRRPGGASRQPPCARALPRGGPRAGQGRLEALGALDDEVLQARPAGLGLGDLLLAVRQVLRQPRDPLLQALELGAHRLLALVQSRDAQQELLALGLDAGGLLVPAGALGAHGLQLCPEPGVLFRGRRVVGPHLLLPVLQVGEDLQLLLPPLPEVDDGGQVALGAHLRQRDRR